MTDHIHKWKFEDEWDESDHYTGRTRHYTGYRCTDPMCSIHKVILKETTTFEYLVDMSFDI